MKAVLLSIFLFVLVGCTSFQEKTFKLHQGQSQADVKKSLGTPKLVETRGSRTTYTYFPDYEDYEYPYYVEFADGALVSWGADQEREAQAKAAAVDYYRRMNALSNALSAGAQNLNQTNQQRSPSGRVDMACSNKCAAEGSMLDFCMSKCSY